MARLEIITGPMFAGKSEELIRRLHIALHADKKILVVKPKKDSRSDKEVYSRRKKNGDDRDFEKFSSFPAHSIESTTELQDLIDSNNPDILAMDEGQFFDISFVDFIKKIMATRKYRNLSIIISGLDRTSDGDPFPGPMPSFMAIAHDILKLKAVCFKCKQWPPTAELTFYRGSKKSVVLVGDANTGYEARCQDCHESK